ncbi:uncharacterized protein TRAVEDRAFT_46074 [Trametes versicolor FP-101664 SS1]|uniref:uncharacterized protein n=1 Tax=Trametes versicolor (strain FP-101664) TaxID=717944 RepID=UPI00046226FB|nr:uncharacterized protein TRAVEDRAFT_46074 [Trametes versicolor FP-101664 SS1]EIW60835.1 hypothetical protein TRAVEDRAFT_46074 [Trametes versicolor FP-101664 SS1]
MHAKIFATLLLSVLAVNALPAKRDDNASLYQSQAKELLDVVNSEISAAGPTASAYTAFITTIGGRPVVEMSESVSGKVWVAMTSSTAAASATARPANDAAADPASSAGSSTASDSQASSSAASTSSQAASATGTK